MDTSRTMDDLLRQLRATEAALAHARREAAALRAENAWLAGQVTVGGTSTNPGVRCDAIE